jgi:hypothetical protein
VDDDAIEPALEAERQPRIRMMEKDCAFKHELVDDEGRRVKADQHDKPNAERHREQDLAEVKPYRGAHIEIQIGVVDVVKTPKEADAMRRHVPPVVGPIHEQNSPNSRDRRGCV